jgi:hypothetical protein
MISPIHELERSSSSQPVAHAGYEVQLGKLISSPLKEEHRQIDPVQVIGSASAGLAWRVKGEAEKG